MELIKKISACSTIVVMLLSTLLLIDKTLKVAIMVGVGFVIIKFIKNKNFSNKRSI